MSYRLDNSNGVTLLSGRDIPAAVAGLERALVAGLADAASESESIRGELALARAENIALAARLAALEAWALALTRRE